jgi:type VI protein secretion system component VasF
MNPKARQLMRRIVLIPCGAVFIAGCALVLVAYLLWSVLMGRREIDLSGNGERVQP